MELKNIALDETHKALGAKMMPFAGYNMPVRYTSGVEEHLTVRKGVGIFDVSHMGEFILSGPQVLNHLQLLCSNDVSKIEVGQAQYNCLPNDQGGIVDDLLVYRLDHEKYMLVVNASNIEKDWNWISTHNEYGTHLQNISDDTCLFAVQGPLAIKALQNLTEVDLSSIKFYRFQVGHLAGMPNVIISATGYTGSGGFELYLPAHQAQEVWDQIMISGEPHGIKPIGLGARDTLRLEKGYCLYGNDIDDSTSPLEAGLGWITKFNKEFIGSEILARQKEAGITRKLVGFVMDDRGIPRQGYEIMDQEGSIIGKVTSGSQSPSLSKGIGLGYVAREQANVENNILINIRSKPHQATVKKLPLV